MKQNRTHDKQCSSCTELVFILDRSGSMAGLEGDTIGGFNGMLRKQKGEPGNAVVTTVLFDDQYELLHNRVPIRAVRPLNNRQYYVRGCTALLDAIGRTIVQLRQTHGAMEPAYRPDKVLFVITTDGYENASREYSWAQVKELVEAQKARGWEFLFLGANLDAVSTAAQFGIHRDRAVQYHADRRGTALNYQAVSSAVSAFRSNRMAPEGQPCAANWKQEVEADFAGRSREDR